MVLPTELLLHPLQHRGGFVDLVGLAVDAKFLIAIGDGDAESLAQQAQVSVRRPEEGQSFIRLFEGDVDVHFVLLQIEHAS